MFNFLPTYLYFVAYELYLDEVREEEILEDMKSVFCKGIQR